GEREGCIGNKDAPFLILIAECGDPKPVSSPSDVAELKSALGTAAFLPEKAQVGREQRHSGASDGVAGSSVLHQSSNRNAQQPGRQDYSAQSQQQMQGFHAEKMAQRSAPVERSPGLHAF